MNKDILDLNTKAYEYVSGYDELERDSEGFIILKPTAKRADERKANLTTSISDLESKLKKFKEEKSKITKFQQTEEYKESKKELSKKKKKKQKETLLSMVFNNADAVNAAENEEPDEDEEGIYKDKKQKKNKPKETTLDSTYGKRFSPVVSMLHDTITEFDQIANTIQTELDSGGRSMSKTMYKSSQIGNLISAKKSKLDAVKELASVAKTISDLEYKEKKDKKNEESGDSNKALSSIAAKYLRGGFDVYDSKKKKNEKNKNGKKSDKYYDDSDDDDTGSVKKMKNDDEERALAAEFAKSLGKHKDNISITPHEKYINMEGKYSVAVVCDPLDPNNSWKFIAISTKNGKEIEGFKDDYPGLLPKKKSVRPVFDLSKGRMTDRNSSRSYKLYYNN